jgi:hypothetical protein
MGVKYIMFKRKTPALTTGIGEKDLFQETFSTTFTKKKIIMRAKRLFTVSPERNRNMGTILHRMRVPSRNLSTYPSRVSFAQVSLETIGKATFNMEGIVIVP